MSRLSLLAILVTVTSISGCGLARDTLPSMDRVVHHAKISAKQPATWLPIATAAAIGITGVDNRITDWASDETPIFGSQSSARRNSDNFRDALVAGMSLSSVFAPTNADDNAFPTRRVVANTLAFSAVAGIVEVGKVGFGRDRPNNRDDRSFPSGHSSGAFSSAFLIEKNLNATVERPWLRNTIKAGVFASATAVAWARVEAEEHHPTDVLFSAGLSNFVVNTIYNAVMSEDQAAVTPIALEASRDGFMFSLGRTF